MLLTRSGSGDMMVATPPQELPEVVLYRLLVLDGESAYFLMMR